MFCIKSKEFFFLQTVEFVFCGAEQLEVLHNLNCAKLGLFPAVKEHWQVLHFSCPF